MSKKTTLTRIFSFLFATTILVTGLPNQASAATQYAYKVRTAQYEYSDNTMTYLRYGKCDLNKRKNLSFSMDIYIPKSYLEQKAFFLNLNFDVFNSSTDVSQLTATNSVSSSYLGVYNENGKYRANIGDITSSKRNKIKLSTTKNYVVINLSKIKLYDLENTITTYNDSLEISPYFSLLTYEAIDFYVDNLVLYSGSSKLCKNTSNSTDDILWYRHGQNSADGTSQASPFYPLQPTKIDTLKLSKSSGTVGIGQTLKIKATDSLGGKITYTSKNKKIATVDKNGTIKGIKKGKTTIQASVNGMTEKFTVTVK